jgi:hypothetical protein
VRTSPALPFTGPRSSTALLVPVIALTELRTCALGDLGRAEDRLRALNQTDLMGLGPHGPPLQT